MYIDAPLKTYSNEKGYNITFTHVPTGKRVSFAAFLTSFDDSYSSNWSPDKIYGRTDPIYMFQQTTRTISFSIDIPSADETEGEFNLASVRNLTRFLYPAYQLVDGRANIIDDSPLIRIKFANLIGRGPDGVGSGNLLGRISTVSVSPVIDAGFFDAFQVLYPKVLNLSISFDVIHEESPTKFPVEGSPVDPYAEDKTGNTGSTINTINDTATSTISNGSEDRNTASGLENNNTNAMSNEEFERLKASGATIYLKDGFVIDTDKTRAKAAELEKLKNSTNEADDSREVSSEDEQLDEQQVLRSATK